MSRNEILIWVCVLDWDFDFDWVIFVIWVCVYWLTKKRLYGVEFFIFYFFGLFRGINVILRVKFD